MAESGASSTALLGRAAAELAAQSVGPAAATLTAFDNAVEENLARIDEVSALIESVRLSRDTKGD
jgi:hypothetical protein